MTQYQCNTSDVTENDNADEDKVVDCGMSPPRKDETCQVFEVIRSCCLFQDDGQKCQKSVRDRENGRNITNEKEAAITYHRLF